MQTQTLVNIFTGHRGSELTVCFNTGHITVKSDDITVFRRMLVSAWLMSSLFTKKKVSKHFKGILKNTPVPLGITDYSQPWLCVRGI